VGWPVCACQTTGSVYRTGEKNPGKNFMMIMPAPSEKENESFKQQAARWKEEASNLTNMTFIESVPFSEVQQYYNQAQLFVNTSLWEGFPNTFIQSCIGGTPIASLKVDPDGFITKNLVGICCEDRFETLVDFVAGLTEEKVKHLGHNALHYVKQHHDIQMTGILYEDAIESLMTENREHQTDEASGEYK
jgi:glycosyltransferase involved in cell wall biosynthesis